MAKILIVDDEPLIAMMLSEWLLEQGLEPIGLAHFEAQAFDLAYGDWTTRCGYSRCLLGDKRLPSIADALQARGKLLAFATGQRIRRSGLSRIPRGQRRSRPLDFSRQFAVW